MCRPVIDVLQMSGSKRPGGNHGYKGAIDRFAYFAEGTRIVWQS